MYIKKNNLVIRSAELRDAEKLNAWWNDGAVMAHAGFPNGLGQPLEETEAEIKAYEGKLSQLCVLEIEGVPVGEASFGLIGEGVAEIGIKICNFAYQNQGYGSELLRMLITYLFEDSELNEKYPVDKIILDTSLKNVRAQRVYEKLGFEKVRVNIGSWRDQLGELQDSVDYELSREMYEVQDWSECE